MVFDRINIKKILKSHIATFYDYGELQLNGIRKTPLQDKIVFLFIPAIISISLTALKVFFNEFYISAILTCLALFIGLLFNFLTLIYQIVSKLKLENIEDSDYKLKARFLLSQELFINVSFSIALSILCVFALLLTQFHPVIIVKFLSPIKYYDIVKLLYQYITAFIAYFLIIEFVFTLLMILRRFFLIFDKEFNN